MQPTSICGQTMQSNQTFLLAALYATQSAGTQGGNFGVFSRPARMTR